MKAILIDWLKKVMDVQKSEDVIIVMKLKDGRVKSFDEITDFAEAVGATKKIYKRMILRSPDGKEEMYYVNAEDAQRIAPIIEGIIQQQLAAKDKQLYQLNQRVQGLTGMIMMYRKRWYNQIADGILRRRLDKKVKQGKGTIMVDGRPALQKGSKILKYPPRVPSKISEGKVVKGGVNQSSSTTPRPETPKGQK